MGVGYLVDQEKIHDQCLSDDPKERSLAADQFKYFSSISDKEQAWNDLHRLITDENRNVRSLAAYALRFAFSHVPDKQQAWDDLHRLNNDKNSESRNNN